MSRQPAGGAPHVSPFDLYPAAAAMLARLAWLERRGEAALRRHQRAALRRITGHAAPHGAPLERDALRVRAEGVAPSARMVEVATSGSSGQPLRLPVAPREYAAGLALVHWGFHKSGIAPGARIAHLCVPPGGGGTRRERVGAYRVLRLDLRESVRATWDALRAFAPQAIYGYPSHLALLAREGGGAVRPRVVVTNGEILSPAARALIAAAFGCPVRDSYGATELPRIAWECAAGTLHVIDAAVLLEADAATTGADGAADLLVTSLYHRALPLVRYRIGDRARLAPYARCACGARSSSIAALDGRRDDLLTLGSGRTITPRAVNLLEEVLGVREYQLVQRAPDRFVVRVCPAEGFDDAARTRIAAVVTEGCRPDRVDVEIETVAALPRTASGKRRAVVSEVP